MYDGVLPNDNENVPTFNLVDVLRTCTDPLDWYRSKRICLFAKCSLNQLFFRFWNWITDPGSQFRGKGILNVYLNHCAITDSAFFARRTRENSIRC